MRGRKISGVCELGAGLSVGDIFADCDWRVGLGCLAGYKVTKGNKLCYMIRTGTTDSSERNVENCTIVVWLGRPVLWLRRLFPHITRRLRIEGD